MSHFEKGMCHAWDSALRSWEHCTLYEGMNIEEAAVRYYEQVKPHVYQDSRKNVCCNRSDILPNEEFEAAYQSVLSTIRGRTAAMRSDLGE